MYVIMSMDYVDIYTNKELLTENLLCGLYTTNLKIQMS
jgi:hypothetical protein